MRSEGVQGKAGRLLAEGRLEPLEQARAFTVEGDSDAYMVIVGPDVWFCSCPATVKCSHVVAAERWARAERAAMEHLPGASADLEEFAEYVRCWGARNHMEVGA